MTYNPPGAVLDADEDDTDLPADSGITWPGMERLIDGVVMTRSVSLYAMRGWFDAAVDLAVARARHHGWNEDEAFTHAVERLTATLHSAVDVMANLKLTAGARRRIQ